MLFILLKRHAAAYIRHMLSNNTPNEEDILYRYLSDPKDCDMKDCIIW